MLKLSFLDLVPVTDSGTIAQSLANAADLARHAEALGYHRYWVAEHHGMAGIASAATAVVLAHIGHATSTMRIGAGGIMLPNHAPRVIAEQFGTLEALFPGRVDLGLGRAPGSDGVVARALRRNLASDERLGIRAVPGEGSQVPLWILGSSLFGAQLAAMLGLPYAFASHFAPDALDEALDIYRRQFKASAQLSEPYAAAAFNVFAADTREEAELLASSQQQAFVALRTGNPGKMKPPLEGYKDGLPPNARAILDHVLQCSAVGTVDDVAAGLKAFVARTGVDEVIVASSMYDHEARKHSVALAMEAARGL
jgi:alkanesulfonate monooxygenase SsuD/methylene tetrahydromethanopterin reductase-like flavin-dependent oxidoreductase (luciferase family)